MQNYFSRYVIALLALIQRDLIQIASKSIVVDRREQLINKPVNTVEPHPPSKNYSYFKFDSILSTGN